MIAAICGAIVLFLLLLVLWKWIDSPEDATRDIRSIKRNVKEIAHTILDSGDDDDKPGTSRPVKRPAGENIPDKKKRCYQQRNV